MCRTGSTIQQSHQKIYRAPEKGKKKKREREEARDSTNSPTMESILAAAVKKKTDDLVGAGVGRLPFRAACRIIKVRHYLRIYETFGGEQKRGIRYPTLYFWFARSEGCLSEVNEVLVGDIGFEMLPCSGREDWE